MPRAASTRNVLKISLRSGGAARRKLANMENENATRVLIVDDDEEFCELMREHLRREGLPSEAVHDGESGVRNAQSGDYSIVVLDVMLPGIGGFEVLRRLRAPRSSTEKLPVLMLTARGDEVDRVLGLELGADDYLPKPFSSREMVARLRAILRRASSDQDSEAASTRSPLHVGDLELQHTTRSVKRGADTLEITAAEFDLLELLLRHAGEIVPRETIALEALGRALMPFDRSIDVHVSNLRRKLGAHQNGGERIKAVRGVGYIYLGENQ